MHRLFAALVIMLTTSAVFAVSPIPPYTMWPCDRNAPPGSPSACSTADPNDCFSYGTYPVREALQYRNGPGRSTRSNPDEPVERWGICSNFNQWCAQEPQIGSAAYDVVVNPDGGRDALFSIEYDFPDSYCQVYDDGPPCYASVFPPKHVIEIPPVRLMLVDAATNNIVYSVPAAFEAGTWKPRVSVGCGAVDRTFRVIALAGGGFGGCTAKTAEVRVTISAPETEPNVCYADKWCPDCTDTTPAPAAGKPIALGSGDVSLSQPLFSIDQPPMSLMFGLTYHSERPVYPSRVDAPLGFGWSHTFSDTLRRVDAHHTLLYRHDGEGHETHYEGRPGGPWFLISPAELRGRQTITLLDGRYILRDIEGKTTTFSALTGRWQSTTDRWGNSINAVYDANGFLAAVRDTMGREITITGPSGTITALTLPTGETWRFEYEHGSLARIFDPIHTGTTPWRSYEYKGDSEGRPRLLIAARDESGALLEGHDYDSQERGITSFAEGRRDMVTVTYAGEGRTRVTTSIGDGIEQQTEYTMRYKGGRWLPLKIIGSCSSCGASSEQQTFTLSDSNRALTRTDGNGHVTRYTYDFYGNVTSRTDASGTAKARTTLYFYERPTWKTFVTRVVEPSAAKAGATKTTAFAWNADETVLTRSESGWLSSTDVMSTTYMTTLTFDTRHRLLATDGPRTDIADVSTRAYYSEADADLARRGRVRSTTNAAGHTIAFADYDTYGTARHITNANNVVTTVVTDRRGRSTSSTIQAVSGDATEDAAYTTTMEYDGRDRLTRTTRPRGNGTHFQYEAGSDRVIDITRFDEQQNEIERQHFTLNDLGEKVLEEDQACVLPAPACAVWTTRRSIGYSYDRHGRLEEIRHPVPSGAKARHAYDADGLLVSVQDENHTAPNTLYTYDALDRLVTSTQVLPTVPGGMVVTRYDYDVMDNVVAVVDANGNVTRYSFDDFRRMTRQESPVTGVTTHTYDAAGNLVSSTDARGAVTTRTSDALGRALTAVSTLDGMVESVTLNYDDPDSGRYGVGRITSIADTSGETQYAYDRRGMVRRETKTILGSTYVTEFRYDANGNRAGVTYPSGRRLTYEFDHADRPRALSGTFGGASKQYIADAAYEPFGPVRSLTYGTAALGWRATYDSRYRIETLHVAANDAPLVAYRYGHDAIGNITAITDAAGEYTRSFAYDDLNRLTTATTGPALWGSAAWTYDSMGNLLTSRLGVQTRSFAYVGTTPKLASVTEGSRTRPVTYDNAGNERNVGLTTFSYSPNNELAAADGLRYVYDGRGVRVAQVGLSANPIITEQPRSAAACPGALVTLSVRASSATKWQWEFSTDAAAWTVLADANSSSLTVNAHATTYYRVVISNAAASTTSDVAAVTAVALATEPNSNVLFGDVTRDGVVNSVDAAVLRAVIVGKGSLPVSQTVADLNADGGADALDLALLTAYSTGAITCLPQFTVDSSSAVARIDAAGVGGSATTVQATVVPTQYFFYSPEKSLLSRTDIDTDGGVPQIAADYIWFGGIPVAEENTDGLRYTISDHLGTPFLQTTAAGVPTWWVEYEPFGTVWRFRNGVAGDQRLRLPGQEYDEQTPERLYNVFRWYRSSWSRYTQFDPAWDLRVNPYAYVSGNPLLLTDPAGLWAVTNKKAGPGINTIVCDGKGGIEPHVGAPGTKQQEECFGDCLYMHELMHATDAAISNPSICQGKAQGLMVVATDFAEQKMSEHGAYDVTFECLEEQKKTYTQHKTVPKTHTKHKKSKCPCIPLINQQIQAYKNEQKKYK